MADSALPQYFLPRQSSTSDGTIGELMDAQGKHICFTAELPWLDNEPQKSCIPTGTYTCVPHNSPAHPNTWELQDVPGRSGILIHNGNSPAEDSMGCILVGDPTGEIDGLPAVLNSVETLEMLRLTLPATFSLTITNRDMA